jgi:hypothetical protein
LRDQEADLLNRSRFPIVCLILGQFLEVGQLDLASLKRVKKSVESLKFGVSDLMLRNAEVREQALA